MKLTLDQVCITSGKLCSRCQDLYDKDMISNIDIDLGNAFLNVAKSQRFLSNITILKFVETAKRVYIVVKKGEVAKLRQAGENLLSQLKAVNSKKYIFLEKTKNVKQLLNMLLYPVMLIGSSTVFLPPDGEKEIKVQVKTEDKNNLEIEGNELSQVTNALLGMRAHYAYV